MPDNRAIGRHFDDPDELFMWLHTAVMGVTTINLANRSGVTTRLLDGPAGTNELAQIARVPADKLARVLDFLLAHELIARASDGRYQANGRTRMMREAAGYLNNAETSVMAASRFLTALREGRSAFEVMFGQPVFDYFADRPERAALFGHFMGFMTRRTTRFLFSQHRFRPFATVADIGGSMGDLLLAVLREYPGSSGILFDLPGTIELARPIVSGSSMAERVKLVGGSFFEHVPAADLYLLKQILHDWNDNECRAILTTIRRAIPANGRLVAIEHVLSDEPTPDEGRLTDVAMMIWATGRERRLSEFVELFRTSGFVIERVTKNPRGHSVIEAVPA